MITASFESTLLPHSACWQTYVASRDDDQNRHVRMIDETTLMGEFREYVRECGSAANGE